MASAVPITPSAPAPAKPKRRRIIPLSAVAGLLVGTSLIGQILGFLRTKLVNANFPAGGSNSTDAYFAAFSIPDFFFFTLAAGALGVAFMPILADHLHKGDKRGVWELAASLMNFLAIIMAFVAIIIMIFAEPLIHHIVAPSLDGEQLDKAVMIMRLIALNPLLFTISGVLTATQQTMGRFFFYAIAPLFYNGCIIISALIFSMANGHAGGPGELGLVGLGIGALVGAILQLLVVMFGLIGTKFHWHPKILWKSADFRQILKQLPPRSLDQGIDQVQSIVEINLASRLGEKFITFYSNAYTLQTAPILLVGTAISTAAFPRLNARISQGRPDLFRRDFLRILRAMIWIAMPVVVVSYFARGYLARLIFTQNSAEIAAIFGFLTVAILFRIMYSIISRWFYAQKDTKTPLLVSIFTIGLNVLLAVTLSRAYGVTGLAMAQSIVALIEVVILFAIMMIRDHKLIDPSFFGGCMRIVSVTGFTILTASTIVALYPLGANDGGFTVGVKMFIISSITIGVHVALSALFGLEEVRPLFYRLKRIVLKPIKIQQYWQ
jgi:putative peptidoglycan lipid II flippase